MTCSLYKIELPSGRAYIGVAHRVDTRWRSHRFMAKSGAVHPLYSSMRKHGIDRARLTVLAVGNRPYILEMEQAAIRSFNTLFPNGFNMTEGGDGGYRLSDATRLKISKSKIRHWCDPAYRLKMQLVNSSRVATPEQNERNRKAKLKNWADPVYRSKCVASHTGKKQSGETIQRRAISLRLSWKNPNRIERAKAAMSGRQWANNGLIHRQLRQHQAIPDGWVRGMLKRKV